MGRQTVFAFFLFVVILQLKSYGANSEVYYRSSHGSEEVCRWNSGLIAGDNSNSNSNSNSNDNVGKEEAIAITPSDLCGINFYAEPKSQDAIVACAKLDGTNPAVEVYRLKSKQNPSKFSSKECPKKHDREGTKAAKLKFNGWCSSVSSILSYSQISRFLGSILNIPNSVYRTIDVIELSKYVKYGLDHGDESVATNWFSLAKTIGEQKIEGDRNSDFEKSKKIYTSDKKSVFGALIEPAHDHAYTGINAGELGFVNSTLWKNLQDPRSIENMFEGNLKSSAQNIIALKDGANMLLLDYILDQADRFGNIGAVTYFYSFGTNGITKRLKNSKKEKLKGDEVEIEEMVLNDNDCGFNKKPSLKIKEMLGKLRHFSKIDFNNWLGFEKTLLSGQWDVYFQNELLLSEEELIRMKTNTSTAMKLLRENLSVNKLNLDNDLESLLLKTDLDN